MSDMKRLIIILISLTLTFIFSGCQKIKDSNNPKGLFAYDLRNNWVILSDSSGTISGKHISSPGFSFEKTYPAKVPSTVLANLIEAGEYENVFYGKNLELIDKNRFKCAWWYRKIFKLDNWSKNEKIQLIFKGINYSADIWLNSKKIASSDSIKGSFRIFTLNVSDAIKNDENVIAVKVYPPKPGDFTIGFVDWNPGPPDKNMGIWRPVTIKRTSSVSLQDLFVKSDLDLITLKKAKIEVHAKIKNLSSDSVTCVVRGVIGKKIFKQIFKLKPYEKRNIIFSPENFSVLNFINPKLWWPYNFGEPYMYNLRMELEINGEVSDIEETKFGIRKIEDYLNKQGHRGYKINGKKILIKGGGWVDDLFLRNDPEKLDAQIQYVKNMNLNCIRLEGFWGTSSKLYDLADKYGILIMAGWSCQWEWEEYLGKKVDEFGGIKTKDDMDIVLKSLNDQVLWLRNHPSVFVWVLGSDRLPRPKLEKKYYELLRNIDPTRPTLASCQLLESRVSGTTGVKMNGPYDYVPPVYWYIDKKNGGAFGFNTETGPGPQPPPIESLKKMIPAENLWPVNSMWNYHCGRNEFNNLNNFINSLDKRYGISQNAEEFVYKSQMASYEAVRAMFESFCVNKFKSTGVIQWMINSAWPEMYWQLYDWYLRPNGAFYGTKKACQPKNIIYNYGDRGIYLHNDTLEDLNDCYAFITLYNFNSEIVFYDSVKTTLKQNSVTKLNSIKIPSKIHGVRFLDLRIKDRANRNIASNFYWIPEKIDVMDFKNTKWFITPVKEYADFKSLSELPVTKIKYNHKIQKKGDKSFVELRINNTGNKIAFFIEAKLVNGKSKEPVLPVFWDDNYFSLMPNESRTIKAWFYMKDLNGAKPEIKIHGVNIRMDK